MITRLNQIQSIFKKIDELTRKKINVYTIGGAVLLERGLKTATKDIDIIVDTREEFAELQRVLRKIGFVPKIPGEEYARMNLSQIYQLGNHRLDIFEKKVCGKFMLTKGMKQRAQKIIEFNNVKLFFCSNEDVFLFKTMTERNGDLEDCERIAMEGIDWNIIFQEINAQISRSKQDIWVTWIGERLDLLEEKGVIIPIMNKINKLRDEYFTKLRTKKLSAKATASNKTKKQ